MAPPALGTVPQRPHALTNRLLAALIILLIIAYLATFVQLMAERGREHLPAPLGSVAVEALARTADHFVHHPRTYLWHKEEVPAYRLVLTTFGRSAGLLLVALGIGALLGVPLGTAMALSKHKASALTMLILSALGVSTPSFLLAMFVWIANIQVHRWTGAPALPPTGFGWDLHLAMPALVLAVMPLAQLAQVTYVTLSDVLAQDFIRTAHAKGLSARLVTLRHAIPNIRVPVLTALGTSMRLSLASLLVVEFFFLWPGVGLVTLEAIRKAMMPLVTDLILCLGLFFLAINLALDAVTPLLDPRLRDGAPVQVSSVGGAWHVGWAEVAGALRSGWQALAGALGRAKPSSALPSLAGLALATVASPLVGAVSRQARLHPTWRAISHNPVLLAGALLALGLAVLAVAGPGFTDASPYQVHGVMMIEGEIGAPPYAPSGVFPWGTDHVGRDVQSLVLSGGRRTLGLAFFAVVCRLLLGTVLGILAGWRQGSRIDRLVTGGITVWAAFPITLFAMLIIQGLGIQQGMWVFVVALCIVGWGEVAQFVRQQVISVQPSLYIEAARSLGASPGRLLGHHVMPQLLSPLTVLAVLQMAAVLLLLAELGFLNVFLGGGYRVMIGEVGAMQAVTAYYSDVPEWGSMLANIRDWWRSYPWMAWYPGLAFFLAILAFNLCGEGLRRFLAESRLNLGRLLNRYSLLAGSAVVVGMAFFLRSSAPLAVYEREAQAFSGQQALEHVSVLAGPGIHGRETGAAGAEAAAAYIADQMARIGLLPAGDSGTFVQALVKPRPHLAGLPELTTEGRDDDRTESPWDESDNPAARHWIYRQDFVEKVLGMNASGSGRIVGLATGPDPQDITGGDPYRLGGLDLSGKVLLISREPDGERRINTRGAAGVLIVSDDQAIYERKYLFPSTSLLERPAGPVLYIRPEVADALLATAGTSLAELTQAEGALGPGEAGMTREGALVNLSVPISESDGMEEKYYNVIGYIPGTGAQMRVGERGLDAQVIMVSAYYDGLGTGPDGTLYPGANDNASGVAALLELARTLKESPYAPEKTVFFVAWAGGERSEGLSVKEVMNAAPGFNTLTTEAVLELSGVAAGDGDEIAIAEGSSYRLVQLFQKAAARLGVATTTRGRGPHYGMKIQAGFGGRDAYTIGLSWDGSDRTAHTPRDTIASLDVSKLERLGRATLLALSVLSRETEY